MTDRESQRERERRWKRFHQWESEYEKEKLRSLSPLEKLRIYEGFYEEYLQFQGRDPSGYSFSDDAEIEAMHKKGFWILRERFLRKEQNDN